MKMRHFFGRLLLLWCLLDHDFLCVVSNGVSVSVMEGDSVTLNTGVEIKQQEDIKWYFNDICIAQNSGDQNKSKICMDDNYEDTERFRDRLKLDHQTGSLTITHTRQTDSGVYKLLISGSSIERVFIVSVHAVPDPGLSSAAVGGICAAVILLVAAAAAAGIYCFNWKSRKRKARQKGNRTPRDDHDQENDVKEVVPLNQRTQTPLMDEDNETETPQLDDDNGTSHNETEQVNDDDEEMETQVDNEQSSSDT